MFKILFNYNKYCMITKLNNFGRIFLFPVWFPFVVWISTLEWLFSNDNEQTAEIYRKIKSGELK